MKRGSYSGALSAMLAAVLLGSPAAALSEVTPRPGVRDSRVRTAYYDPEQIYRLQAHVGYQIELEFEAGESVIGQGGGDLEGIVLAAADNHVFLKPKAADVSTNLTIATNRRRYRFDYVVNPGPPDPDESAVMYLVRFTYPPTLNAGPSAAERIEQALASAHERPRNVDYWYCGHPSVKPTAASDDGVHTRLTFDATHELPALFVRNDDGSESLLNFSIEDGDVIVHRVARRFIVRRGRLTGCVVNQAFTGSGARLESGTVAPSVRRERRERAP